MKSSLQWFVHPGLPKTGTTFLQHAVFPKMTATSLYAGKHRNIDASHSLYTLIRDAVNEPVYNDVKTQKQLRHQVHELSARGVTKVLVSDEMFLVDSRGMSWQKKLDRLGEILRDCHVEIVLGARNPSSGLHSYYAELYPTLSPSNRNPETFVRNSNFASIFDYTLLLGRLETAFPGSPVRVLPFNEVKSLHLDHPLLQDLGVQSMENTRVNVTRRDSSGASITQKLTLRSAASRLPLQDVLRTTIPPALWSYAANRASKVVVGRGSSIPPFSSALNTWIANRFAPGMQLMQDRYGVSLAEESS